MVSGSGKTAIGASGVAALAKGLLENENAAITELDLSDNFGPLGAKAEMPLEKSRIAELEVLSRLLQKTTLAVLNLRGNALPMKTVSSMRAARHALRAQRLTPLELIWDEKNDVGPRARRLILNQLNALHKGHGTKLFHRRTPSRNECHEAAGPSFLGKSRFSHIASAGHWAISSMDPPPFNWSTTTSAPMQLSSSVSASGFRHSSPYSWPTASVCTGGSLS